jgi:hypothetical protein
VSEEGVAVGYQAGQEAFEIPAHVGTAFSCTTRPAEVWRTNSVSRPLCMPHPAVQSATGRVISIRPRPRVSKLSVVLDWRSIGRRIDQGGPRGESGFRPGCFSAGPEDFRYSEGLGQPMQPVSISSP